MIDSLIEQKKSPPPPSSSALLQVPPRVGPVALLPPEAGGREVGIILEKVFSDSLPLQSSEEPVKS